MVQGKGIDNSSLPVQTARKQVAHEKTRQPGPLPQPAEQIPILYSNVSPTTVSSFSEHKQKDSKAASEWITKKDRAYGDWVKARYKAYENWIKAKNEATSAWYKEENQTLKEKAWTKRQTIDEQEYKKAKAIDDEKYQAANKINDTEWRKYKSVKQTINTELTTQVQQQLDSQDSKSLHLKTDSETYARAYISGIEEELSNLKKAGGIKRPELLKSITVDGKFTKNEVVALFHHILGYPLDFSKKKANDFMQVLGTNGQIGFEKLAKYTRIMDMMDGQYDGNVEVEKGRNQISDFNWMESSDGRELIQKMVK